MATEKLNKVVVSGGSRRLGRLLTFLSYGLILASTLILIYLGERRGINETLNLLYYISLGVNAVQVLYALVTWFIEGRGVFFRKRKTFEMIINIIWIVLIVAQFLIGSLTSIQTIRIDLLIIALVQLVIISFVFKFTNYIENNINKRYGHGDFAKREGKKQFSYVLIFIFLAALQISVLFIPKMPPKIDDLWSETRALEYIYDSVQIDGEEELVEGYFVAEIYYGLNDKVVVPATYNNKPVVGIRENALIDSGTISELILGDMVDGELVSNLKVIYANAINLNSIKSLEIPSSLLKIEDGAINSTSIEELTINSNCKLRLNAFNTPKVTEININNDEVVNVDFGDKDYKLIVKEELYNKYREYNYANRNSFKLEEVDNKIVIDFETNCGTYLESKILTLEGGVAYLDLESLKNSGASTNTSFIVDTNNYNDNPYTKLESESNPGHVFRGWYRDSEYKVECDFSNISRTRFSEDTVVYAKWEKIQTIHLDWHTDYKPYNAVTKINYINSTKDEENVSFPALDIDGGDITRTGYTSLKWEYNGKYYEDVKGLVSENPDLPEEITLKAVWTLEKPTIEFVVKNGDEARPDHTPMYVFDGVKKFYEATMAHNANDVTLTYQWLLDGKVIRESQTSGFFNAEFRNVKDSGHYTLICTADNGHGVSSSAQTEFTITIEKRNLDNIFETPDPVSEVYNGLVHNISYDLTTEQKMFYSASILYDLDGDGTYESNKGPVNHKDEYYNALITISRSDDDRDNYNVRTLDAKIYVEQKDVSANWVQTGTEFDGFNVTYSGAVKSLVPSIVGLIESDVDKGIKFITSTTGGDRITVGNYETTISGINFGSNPENYKLASSIEESHTWSIVKKELTSSWKNSTFTYNGGNQYATLLIYGFNEEDATKLTLGNVNSNFGNVGAHSASYNSQASALEVLFDVKNVGSYDVTLSSINDTNYSFTPTHKTLTVDKATLTLSWENVNNTFNANELDKELTIKGFFSDDATKVELSNLGFIAGDTTNHTILNKSGNNVVVSFAALNQGTYSIGLSDISGLDNYVLSTENRTNSLLIKPLLLHGLWSKTNKTYNSELQGALYTISGIPTSELSKFSLDDFETSINGSLDTNGVSCYVDGEDLVLKFDKVNADIYSLQIAAAFATSKLGNYKLETTSTNYQIKPLDLEIEWVGQKFDYDSTAKRVTPVAANLYDGDSINFTVSNNEFTNAGNYNALISAIDNTNYNLVESTKEYSWSISPKKLSATFTYYNIDVYYDGNYKTATLKISGVEASDLKSDSAEIKSLFTFTDNDKPYQYGASLINNSYEFTFSSIDSNKYIITLNDFSDSNYDVEELCVDYEYEIHKRVINLEWDYVNEFTYSGLNRTVTPTITNLATRADTSLMDEISLDVLNNVYKNVGTYSADVNKEVVYANYVLSEDVDYSLDWEIVQKDLTAEWVTLPEYIYNYNDQLVTLKVSGFVNSEENSYLFNDFNYETNTSLKSSSNNITTETGAVLLNVYYKYVGRYTTNFSFDDENYNVTFTEKEINIKPVVLDLTWSDQVFTYNATSQKEMLTASNILGSDVVNFTYEIYKVNPDTTQSLVDSAINAGQYNVKCVSIDNYNYVLPESGLEKAYSIEKKTLTVSWSSVTTQTGYMGGNYTYNKGNQGRGLEISGYVNTDDAENAVIDIDYGTSSYSERFIHGVSGNYTVRHVITSIDAGTYEISLKNAEEENNYVFVEENVSYVIEPLELALSWHDYNTIYNADTQRVYVTADNLCGNDVVNFTYQGFGNSYSGTPIVANEAKEAGVYTVNVTSIDNDNYVLPESGLSNTFTINRVILTQTFATKSKTYNGGVQTYDLSLGGLYASDYDQIDVNLLNFDHNITHIVNPISYENGIISVSVKNAGSYNVTHDEYTFNNYYIASSDQTLSMGQYAVSINWNTVDYTYNGKYQTITATPTNLYGEDEVEFEYANNSMIDAGSYTASITNLTGTDSSNYKLSTGTSKSWSIKKLTIDTTWDYYSAYTYDANIKTVTPTINNLCTREDTSLVDEVTLTYSNNSKINAGVYTAAITGISNSNYTYTSSNNLTWQIKKVKLTSSWSDDMSGTYLGIERYRTLTISGFLPGEASTVTSSLFSKTYNGTLTTEIVGDTFKFKLSATNVGDYSCAINSTTLVNYEIDATEASLSITKAPLTIKYSSVNTYTYDGLAKTYVATVSGFMRQEADNVNDNTFSVSSSYTTYVPMQGKVQLTFTATDAGTIDCSLRGINNNNYSIDVQSEKYLTINPAQLTYNWDENVNSIYNNNNKTLNVTISGFANGQESFVNTSTFDADYTYSVESADYGSVVLSFSAKLAGEYDCDITGLNNTSSIISSNYILVPTTDKKIVIEKADLVYDWSNDVTTTYDGSTHGVTLTISGFYGLSDTTNFYNYVLRNTSNKIDYSLEENSLTITVGGSSVGTYTFDAPEMDVINYNTQMGSRSVKIERKALTVNWSGNTNYTYDGNKHSITATINGFVDADKALLTKSSFVYTYGNDVTYDSENVALTFGGTNAGTYKINSLSLSINNSGSAYYNYYISSTSASFEIAKKKLTIDWSGVPIAVYNGSSKYMTGTVSGIVPGEEATFNLNTFTYNSNASSVYLSASNELKFYATYAGTYYAKNIEIVHTNYEMDTNNIEFKIIKNPLYGSWSSETTYTYNGTEQYVVLTVTGFLSGSLDSINNNANFTYKNGITPIKRVTTSGNNYTVEYRFPVKNTGTYTVGIEAINTTAFSSYDFSSMTKTVTVLPKELTINWPAVNSVSHSIYGVNSFVAEVHGISSNDIGSFSVEDFDFIGDFNPANVNGFIEGDVYQIRFTNLGIGTHSFKLNAGEFGNYYIMSSSYQYTITEYTDFDVSITYPTDTYFSNTNKDVLVVLSNIDSNYVNYIYGSTLSSTEFETASSKAATSVTYIFSAKKAGTYNVTIVLPNGVSYLGSNEIYVSYTINKSDAVQVSLANSEFTDPYDIDFVFTQNGNNFPLVRSVDYACVFYTDYTLSEVVMKEELEVGKSYYVKVSLSPVLEDDLALTGKTAFFVTYVGE